MSRNRLPARRQGDTVAATYVGASGNQHRLEVTLNAGPDGRVREVFTRLPQLKRDAEMCELIHHACILASVALQHGASMADLRHALGADNLDQPPISILQLVAQLGAAMDEEAQKSPEGA